MSAVIKLVTGLAVSICPLLNVIADTHYGGYTILNDRVDAAVVEKQHTGPLIRTIAFVGTRRFDTDSWFSFYRQIGIGYSWLDDRQPYYVTYENGTGDESQVEGLRLWGSLGVSKTFAQNSYFRAGVGAAYFWLNRDVKDCADCDAERIDINLEPYIELGVSLCAQSNVCLELERRQFYTSGLTNGSSFALSFVKKI